MLQLLRRGEPESLRRTQDTTTNLRPVNRTASMKLLSVALAD
ncbi:hypothetical protein THTE_3236 [Thermogutta terrifontis]|uniref:Uncharacterized protein n=1 Tax=Thermogutta terrifontis TaxID=1331910 RepID=A0A286RIP7_9BACT|nr:hypothetical protein THTE_3236 [Thermogutta terrifontis]